MVRRPRVNLCARPALLSLCAPPALRALDGHSSADMLMCSALHHTGCHRAFLSARTASVFAGAAWTTASTRTATPLDGAAVVASLKAAADVQVHQLWHQLADNTPYSPDAGPGAALGWSQARRSGALLTAFESSLSPAMTCTRRCPHRSPQPSRTPGPEHYMYTDTERPSLAAPAAVTSRSVVLAAVSGSSSARGPISPRGRLETPST